MLSTPHISNDRSARLGIPFSDARLDELFQMKRKARPVDEIASRFGDSLENDAAFYRFFTKEVPPPAQSYQGDGFRIRYFGHGCLLIESKDVTILTDPIIGYTYNASPARFTYEDLPERIDYVLITHSHHDHILMETLLQLRHMTDCFVVPRNFDGFLQDPSLQLALEHTGFTNVQETRDLSAISFPGGSITALPFLGEHHDLYVQSRASYRIEIGGKSILCIADSCNLDPSLYDHIYEMFGKADILFLGMECEGAPASWIYGPYFPKPLARDVDQSRRARGSNCAEAVSIIERFGIGSVYVYAMGQEPWLSHILDNEFTDKSFALSECNRLMAYCRERGIPAENLYCRKEILPL